MVLARCLVAGSAMLIALGLWLVPVPGGRSDAADAPTPPAAEKRPLPLEKSNCVKCHTTAGRELTEAVYSFAHSVHDWNGLSCNDCHGGNTEVDAKAHLEEFGFIGTKMSAHLAKCRSCHEDQAKTLAASKHYWDHDAKLNPKFPLCVDCHGNHDVGNPPPEFSLSLVCEDCHKDYRAKYPNFAALTDANDALWKDLRGYRSRHPAGPEQTPEKLRQEIAAVRAETSGIMHGVAALSDARAADLIQKVAALRKKLTSPEPTR